MEYFLRCRQNKNVDPRIHLGKNRTQLNQGKFGKIPFLNIMDD